MSVQSIDLNAVTNFINASDNQLKDAARADAYTRFATDPQRTRESNFATMLPVADSLLAGVRSGGKLSDKGKAIGKSGFEWAIFLGVVALYRKMMNKITDTFPALKEFGQEHPVTATIADTAVGVTAGMSGIHYANKGVSALARKFPKQMKILNNFYTSAVDDSGIGKTLNNWMRNFATNHKTATRYIKNVANWGLPVLCIGMLGVFFYDLVKMSFKKDKNYEELKELQTQAAIAMANQQREQTQAAEEV